MSDRAWLHSNCDCAPARMLAAFTCSVSPRDGDGLYHLPVGGCTLDGLRAGGSSVCEEAGARPRIQSTAGFEGSEPRLAPPN